MYGFIAKQQQAYPVTFMCRVLGVSRAGYYRWQHRHQRGPTPRQHRHQAVTAAIVAIFAECHGRGGRRPMRRLLAQRDVRCSPGMVQQIMAEQGLQARRRRRWRRTTRADATARVAHIPNHCLDSQGRRSFHSDHPGARTVGDITAIPTHSG